MKNSRKSRSRSKSKSKKNKTSAHDLLKMASNMTDKQKQEMLKLLEEEE